MLIRYVSRSSFLPPILDAIDLAGGVIAVERPIQVVLTAQGTRGEVLVEIEEGKEDYFIAYWEERDPTRFPVRVRAAATALRDRGIHGQFIIAHENGLLRIARTQ